VDDDALRRLYRRAAIFLYPSAVEGFGLPVLEAMSEGALPLISPDAALGALIVDVHDPDAVADRILRWLADDGARERKVERLVRRARRYTWQRAARQVVRLYTEVA
jgi:glycosyltransferase involved in cell wall biosynthesis